MDRGLHRYVSWTSKSSRGQQSPAHSGFGGLEKSDLGRSDSFGDLGPDSPQVTWGNWDSAEGSGVSDIEHWEL